MGHREWREREERTGISGNRNGKWDDPGPRETAPDVAATDEAFRRCRTGDSGACDILLILLSRFRRGLICLLRKREGAQYHDSQDAVAEVLRLMLRAARYGTLACRKRDWWTHLYLKARQVWWKSLQRSNRKTLSLEEEGQIRESLAWIDPGLRHVDVRDEFEGLVRRVAGRLSSSEQRVLLARGAGLSYREIADILGISAGVARVHFSHVLRKLRVA